VNNRTMFVCYHITVSVVALVQRLTRTLTNSLHSRSILDAMRDQAGSPVEREPKEDSRSFFPELGAALQEEKKPNARK